MVQKEGISAVPNAVDGQSGLARQRKKRRRERNVSSIVSKRASTSFSRHTERIGKRFGPSKRRMSAPDVENVPRIVGLNIDIYIYIYDHTGSVGGQTANS